MSAAALLCTAVERGLLCCRHAFLQNSWGSWWGESGYFRISYTDPMFCNDGDFGVPVGLTYTPTFLETHPWLNPSVITGPIKQLPVVG